MFIDTLMGMLLLDADLGWRPSTGVWLGNVIRPYVLWVNECVCYSYGGYSGGYAAVQPTLDASGYAATHQPLYATQPVSISFLPHARNGFT